MNNWQIHFGWTIVFAVFLIIGIVTFWLGGKGNEIVSYMSFASTLIAIVLALVAIFYSMNQHTSSQQNIGEMRTLVSEASRIMTEKASSMEQQSVVMSRMTEQLAQSIGTGLPPSATPFYLDVSTCSNSGLLVLYSLAKSDEHNKPLLLSELIKRQYPDPNLQMAWYYYILGLLIGFSCFLEPGSVIVNYVTGIVTVTKLPTKFGEYIVEHIDARIKQESEPMRKLLQEGRVEIDNYFAAAA